jgi:hypothetical protein
MAMAETDRAAARTEEDREFAAISDADIWEEAKDRLKICADAEADNRKRAKEATLFREGQQWDKTPSTSISQDEPELTINLTDALVTRVENNIRQQRPRAKVHPVGEGADVEVAEIINGIIRHIDTRSEASVAYDTAATCALDGGVGYFRIIPEFVDARSFQKDLRILPITNAFIVSMDPSAIMPSGSDQNWCIISEKMKRQEYKRRYPRASNASWNEYSRDEQKADWEDLEDIRLGEYFRIREKEEKLYLIRAADGSELTRYRSELPRRQDGHFELDYAVKRLRERDATIEGDRDSVKRQVEWFRLNGLIVIERQQLPGQWIPVFRVEGRVKNIDGQVRRKGMVEPLMDPARMVNYGEVAKIKRLGLAPKAPWVGAEGQFDGHEEWDDANQKPYSKLVYKPVTIDSGQGPVLLPPPVRQPPAQIEQGFSEFVQGMRANLQAVAGMPNEPGQDQQGVVVSGRALKRRQWLSDQSHFHYYDNLTLAIAQCSRVEVEWIPFYYPEPGRVQRIIGEDSTPHMVTLNQKTQEPGEDGQAIERIKNDLSVGRYDVVMDTGPGYETKREEGAENLIDLLRVGPLAEIIAKTGSDLVFRSIDHPYMQELADRLMTNNPEGLQKIMEGLSSRARSIVQALSNDNAALKQQLQQAMQELKSRADIESMKEAAKSHRQTIMEGAENQRARERNQTELAREMIEDRTWRFDIESKVHGAQSVEEIKGIVQLLLHHLGSMQAMREISAEAQQAGPQANGAQ